MTKPADPVLDTEWFHTGEKPMTIRPDHQLLFDPVADIADFHEKFGLEYKGKPRLLGPRLAAFRIGFMLEELQQEYETTSDEIHESIAAEKPNVIEDIPAALENQLDALVDLVYVALGTAYLHGFDFRTAWRRVHHANMQKVKAEPDDTRGKRDTAFDVVKPAGWTAPSHADLVKDHAHK
jgi:predicted HAD superfamily Cof-like phosphohydrolase